MVTNLKEITYRPAQRKDVPEIVRMMADDPLGAKRENYKDPLPLEYWESFDRMQAEEDNHIILAEHKGRIVACLQLVLISGLGRQGMIRGQIESVRVQSDLRGLGIGNAIMQQAIDAARAKGCKLVQLTTDNSRDDAHRFYERLGFENSHLGMKLIF